MCPCDGVHVPVNVNQLTRRINQVQSVEKRYLIGGTDIYTTTSSNFDGYGFAINSHASNNFSDYEEFTARTYLHDTNNGMIGWPLTVSRTEESRGGKERVSTGRVGGSQSHEKKKTQEEN